MTGAEIELVLDLRDYRIRPKGAEDFLELWAALEPALYGRTLHLGQKLAWDSPDGAVTAEVMRLAPGLGAVGPATTVEVADVRERAKLIHQCRLCQAAGAPSYAPMTCRACSAAGVGNAKLCVDHAVFLGGSVLACCPDHQPACQGCGRPARFWCSGPRCREPQAWCEEHRRRHPSDPDTDYCPPCYDATFPACEVSGCAGVGTVACDWMDAGARSCDRRSCTRHAHRWQVYGGEKLGLGLCHAHRRLSGLEPQELLFQIVGGTTRRSGRRPAGRMPSLAGFAHSLRNTGHRELALDFHGIDAYLRRLEQHAVQNRLRGVADAMRAARKTWDQQLAQSQDHAAQGRRLTQQLCRLILASDQGFGAELAAAVSYADFRPARSVRGGGERDALLFVHVPQHLRGRFIGPGGDKIRMYGRQLGVQIKIEGGRR